MDHPILVIVMRYLHIVSAIVLVGGWVFMSWCMIPATRLLDDSFRESLMAMLKKRFVRLVWFSLGGLLVSGVYNWMLFAGQYKQIGPKANALIGLKVLLALILFAHIWARSAGLIQCKSKAHLTSHIHLAAIIILLAGVLRYFRLAAGG